MSACLEPTSINSNETPLNGNGRHSHSELTIQERANKLFQDAEILAPMVRASSTQLRSLALSYGCDLVYSEEIVDRSIITTERVYNEELQTIDYRKKMESFSAKQQRRMKAKNEPVPTILRIAPSIERNKLIYQMGTGEASLALPSALMVQNDVDGIDINMGCPKKFSVSGGMGAALLQDLPRACNIISTLRKNLHVPVSCKIRLIKDTKTTVDFVTALVKAGANAVAIHGREVGDESQMPAKLDRLVDVVQTLKSSSAIDVPIIINGDLYTRNDMVNIRKRSGADAVMLARPALYNTSIFIKPPVSDLEGTPLGEETRYGYDSKLLLSKTQVIQDYLTHSHTYSGHIANVKYVVCEMLSNRRTPSILSQKMPQSYPGGQTIGKVCNCRSVVDMCKLWDVSKSSISKKATRSEDSSKFKASAVDLHRYDDRYFLNPEELQREREGKAEIAKTNEEKNVATRDNVVDGMMKTGAKKPRLH
mmetsp:Transcript_12306/g.17961  ORF Transcript_12306/g.17961 Transcript_12306/m.17961 type:complete len:479 (+) Transcript_12306:66-1502(+)